MTTHAPRPATGRRLTALLAASVALSALAACGSDSESQDGSGGSRPRLAVSGAYMPEPVTADMAGGFLTVRNTGGTADRLTSVKSKSFGEAQLHSTSGQQMQHVNSLAVPADGTLRLARGGNHIMFLKPERKPVKGEKVRVTLHFSKSGDIDVTMPVEATNFVPKK
ncbi:copper chaperone PCu(A)C [Streptomyces marispadix]|uniref:Copper chaperone PCu(A)C n=1 Tax=Streptomyces marispadix TaxID=2922868 RepID=A0ABS9SZS4_9ACTN|nr:copper chaperone PCu(A)C [Streptomyces marispadix]MCH6161541.1 copper chaperone PCu(A)C [Streptomyces marispadix]